MRRWDDERRDRRLLAPPGAGQTKTRPGRLRPAPIGDQEETVRVLWLTQSQLPAATGQSSMIFGGWHEGLRSALEEYEPDVELGVVSLGAVRMDRLGPATRRTSPSTSRGAAVAPDVPRGRGGDRPSCLGRSSARPPRRARLQARPRARPRDRALPRPGGLPDPYTRGRDAPRDRQRLRSIRAGRVHVSRGHPQRVHARLPAGHRHRARPTSRCTIARRWRRGSSGSCRSSSGRPTGIATC